MDSIKSPAFHGRLSCNLKWPVYTKRQRQHCNNSAMMLQNGFAIHFQASPLISMRTESLASSQTGRSVDADAWCKRALKWSYKTGSSKMNMKWTLIFHGKWAIFEVCTMWLLLLLLHFLLFTVIRLCACVHCSFRFTLFRLSTDRYLPFCLLFFFHAFPLFFRFFLLFMFLFGFVFISVCKMPRRLILIVGCCLGYVDVNSDNNGCCLGYVDVNSDNGCCLGYVDANSDNNGCCLGYVDVNSDNNGCCLGYLDLNSDNNGCCLGYLDLNSDNNGCCLGYLDLKWQQWLLPGLLSDNNCCCLGYNYKCCQMNAILINKDQSSRFA